MTDQEPKPDGPASTSSEVTEDAAEEPTVGRAEADASESVQEAAEEPTVASGGPNAPDVDATPTAAKPARKAGRAGDPPAGAQGKPVDELPYVDDRVTKWWVGIVVAVFIAIFAYALLLGRGGLLSDLFTSDPPALSPSPSAPAIPSPSAEPSPSPEGQGASPAAPSPTATPAPSPGTEVSPLPTLAPTDPVSAAGSPGLTGGPPSPGS
ncbi:hypothetical protein BH24CHL9_BH24CHL9_08530 [soil metagenome]